MKKWEEIMSTHSVHIGKRLRSLVSWSEIFTPPTSEEETVRRPKSIKYYLK